MAQKPVVCAVSKKNIQKLSRASPVLGRRRKCSNEPVCLRVQSPQEGSFCLDGECSQIYPLKELPRRFHRAFGPHILCRGRTNGCAGGPYSQHPQRFFVDR